MTDITAAQTAKFIQWFFENNNGGFEEYHSHGISPIESVNNEIGNQFGISFDQPIINDYGVFGAIAKNARLHIEIVQDAIYAGISVDLRFDLSYGNGSNNSYPIVQIVCTKNEFGLALENYQFVGKERQRIS